MNLFDVSVQGAGVPPVLWFTEILGLPAPCTPPNLGPLESQICDRFFGHIDWDYAVIVTDYHMVDGLRAADVSVVYPEGSPRQTTIRFRLRTVALSDGVM